MAEILISMLRKLETRKDLTEVQKSTVQESIRTLKGIREKYRKDTTLSNRYIRKVNLSRTPLRTTPEKVLTAHKRLREEQKEVFQVLRGLKTPLKGIVYKVL